VGKVAPSLGVAGGTELSSHASKEISLVSSPGSSEKRAPSSKSSEFVQSVASVLNDDGVTSPSALDEQTATAQNTSLDKVTPSVTKPEDVVSTLPKTPKTVLATPPNQSANCLDSQHEIKTEPTEKSKTLLKSPTHSGAKLLEDSSFSTQKLEKAVEFDGSKLSALIPDVSQQQETNRPGVNKDETGGESTEGKHMQVNNYLEGAVQSLERHIQDKRLTPEGAEADTRPASSADIAVPRKYNDSTGPQTTFPAQLHTNKSLKSSLVEVPPSMAELPKSSGEKVTLKESSVDEEIFPSRKKPEGEDQSELEGVTPDDGIVYGKKRGETKGISTDGMRFQGPSTIKKEANEFEGFPTYRKVSVSRSIRDTVDDIVQKMLDSADEPNLEPENPRPSGSDPLEGMRRDSEMNFEVSKRFGRERNVSRTVIETVDFLVQTVLSSDERRPRQTSGRQFNTGW